MLAELLLTGAGALCGLAGGWFLRSRRTDGAASPPSPAAGEPPRSLPVRPVASETPVAGDAPAGGELAGDRFEELLRSLTVGIVTLDRRGHVVTANAAAGSILEFGDRPVLGRAMIEVVPSFDLDRHVREALDGDGWRGQITFPAPRPRVLTVATLPIETGAIVIASDETRLHELERTRRDFVSSVSHELRTPLSSISLMIETILAAREDDQALEMFLPRVKLEVDRMIALVEDLLELARAETGQMRLRLEPLDLGVVAAGIAGTFEPRARQADVRLEIALPERPVVIDGDRDRLAQVFVNLIDNALRHTPKGGEVLVTLGANDQRAMLEVSDTGIGIPYNDLPHLFERFYVVERSRARGSGGTGLGLSIVKQIVEAHRGRVFADSEFGYGATFTIALPLARSGRPRAQGPPPASNVDATAP